MLSLLLLLLLLMMMTHIFNVNTNQQQFNPHKPYTLTLHIPLLLFLDDMFQQFIQPSSGCGYKYIKKKVCYRSGCHFTTYVLVSSA
jgi:hypothetical protein